MTTHYAIYSELIRFSAGIRTLFLFKFFNNPGEGQQFNSTYAWLLSNSSKRQERNLGHEATGVTVLQNAPGGWGMWGGAAERVGAWIWFKDVGAAKRGVHTPAQPAALTSMGL